LSWSARDLALWAIDGSGQRRMQGVCYVGDVLGHEAGNGPVGDFLRPPRAARPLDRSETSMSIETIIIIVVIVLIVLAVLGYFGRGRA
jgi:hypothetical protein